MTRRFHRCRKSFALIRRAVAGALLALAVAVPAAAGEADRVTIRATGFHTLAAGTPVEVAHRRALQDALRNALYQAGASVDSRARVEGQVLVERGLTVRTQGSVASVRVVESGLLADQPEVYRVLIDAVVRQTREPEVATFGDDWRPRLVLRFDTAQPLHVVMAHGPSLQRALVNSGIDVVEEVDDRTAMLLQVSLRSLGSAPVAGGQREQVLDIAWTLGYSADADAGIEGGFADRPQAASGEWMVAIGEGAEALWWDRVAVQLAQHALRIWNSSHWVAMTVYGLSVDEIAVLERLPGAEIGSVRPAEAGQTSVVNLRLPVRGEAAVYAAAALRGVGLSGRLTRVTISGQGLEYLATQ